MPEQKWVHRSERLKVTLHARMAAPDGAESGVTLVNINSEGCCLTTGGATLATGTPVLVRLESGDSLQGTVRWCDGEKAGLAFQFHLPPARVEYLRREHTTFLAEADGTVGKVQRSVC
ncbi:PilZ domain-containing protein [Novosphingobium bradum]|uniref:PilZ domain-containing protein n=1 Tax=Novosphingobium bradum TaxID=1737444 RepID=A0ABV7IL40_9SPHN